MKVRIDVKSRAEAEAVQAALTDPFTRAVVVVTGVLQELPSDRARQRVLNFVADKLEEEQEQARLSDAPPQGKKGNGNLGRLSDGEV